MKMNVFLPGQLLVKDGAYFTIATNDCVTEVRQGIILSDLAKSE